MIRKTVRYRDPIAEEMVEEELYFHLSAAELLEIRIENKDGVGDTIQLLGERIQKAQDEGKDVEDFPEKDIPKLFAIIKMFLLRGYGERIGGGRSFTKSEDLTNQFAASEAYSALVLEMCSDAVKGAEFINGMVPSDFGEQLAKITGEQASKAPLMAVPDVPMEIRTMTRSEYKNTPETVRDLIADDISKGKIVVIDDPDLDSTPAPAS